MFRLLGILLAAALISALLFGACVSACGVAVVSVVAEEGPNFVAPIPLMLPLAALHFVPDHLMDDAMHEEMDEFGGPALVGLGGFLGALEEAEDAVLVRVTEPDNEVIIAKEGGDLVIRVREAGTEGARVFVRTPLRALSEAVQDACEERETSFRCSPGRMARSLIPVLRGTEIEVRDGNSRVDVTVW